MEKAFLVDRSRDPGEMSGGRVEDGPETSTPGSAHRYLNISTPNQRVAPREIYRRLHILYRRIDRISIASLTLEIPFLCDYRPIIRLAKSIES